MTFGQIFAGRASRTELVGLFLALLELARRRAVFLEQDGPRGEINVFFNPDPPPPPEPAGPAPDRAAAEGQADPAAAEGASHTNAEESNEHRSEAQGDGP